MYEVHSLHAIQIGAVKVNVGVESNAGRKFRGKHLLKEGIMTCDFESLSCPMCGGELIYSEGTHDLCCIKNTSELSSLEMGRSRNVETAADRGERFRTMPGDKLEGSGRALHEPRAGYGSTDGSARINGPGLADEAHVELRTLQTLETVTEKSEGTHIKGAGSVEEASVEMKEYNSTGQAAEKSKIARTKKSRFAEGMHVELRTPQTLETVTEKSENTRRCVFAVSFTESANFGTLWSIRTVHGGTNYFALMRLIDKIEKRQKRGAPLAANVPNLPRKVERSKECKLAFRYSLEVEDLYSIKYSSETVNKLAMYYGLSEPDIRHIQAVEIGEG
jgi:hypothetical protein